MKLTEQEEKAVDFFIAWGRAHGAEVRVGGELLDRPLDEQIGDIFNDDYYTDRSPTFPITLTLPFKSSANPDAPPLGFVSDQVKSLRYSVGRMLSGYDTDPNRFSGWNLADKIHAQQITHGPGLKGGAIEITINTPSGP
jgi:hypothetical protein